MRSPPAWKADSLRNCVATRLPESRPDTEELPALEHTRTAGCAIAIGNSPQRKILSQVQPQNSLAERFLRSIGLMLARILYRVSTSGKERLPAGGFLLLPNHLTWVDALVLQLACPRPIRFIISDAIYALPFLNVVFRAVQAIPISSRHAKEAVRIAVERIERGEVICIFPEGELSRTGTLLRLKRGYELIARAAQCPI